MSTSLIAISLFAAVVFATQSLADIHRSEHRHVLYESCPTKIFLPNPEAATRHGAALYREIGLSEREPEMVATAVPTLASARSISAVKTWFPSAQVCAIRSVT